MTGQSGATKASDPLMKPIGFIGLGRMGRPMVERIVKQGFSLCVFDHDPLSCASIKGVTVAQSPQEIGSICNIVFSCVSTADAYDAVALGPKGFASGGATQIYVHLGTTGAAHVQKLAHALNAFNIDTLDAPMSGGVVGAVDGALVSMVSGSPDTLAHVKKLIGSYSGRIMNFGPAIGVAQIAKLINNGLLYANLLAALEGLVMGMKAGIAPPLLADLIAASSGSSYANDIIIRRDVVTGSFAWGGTVEILRKDLMAWQALADQLGVELPLNRAAADIFLKTIKPMTISEDFTRVIDLVEKREGIIRNTP
jgi:3-hydroxyisobutyrate dehydrogenase-like beta-hydroxyacid dehydrogenase